MPAHSSVEIYFRQIKSIPLLTPERERHLARQIIRENNSSAREEMILANLRLVVSIARKFVNRGLCLQDLVAEGNVGLLKAAERFNPDHGTRFSTYATWWIRQAIRRALARSVAPLHIPPYMTYLIAREKRAANQIQANTGILPTRDELSAKLSFSPRRMHFIHQTKRMALAPARDLMEDDSVSFNDRLHDVKHPAPQDAVSNNEQVQFLRRLLRKMDPREAQILRLRFGLDSSEPHTLEQIGATLGLTRERVRQLERQSLRRLNAFLTDGNATRSALDPAAKDEADLSGSQLHESAFAAA